MLSADYLLNEEDGDFFAAVKVEDKSLVERIRLIDSLDPEERGALLKIINALLIKKKVVDLVIQEAR